MKDPAASPPSLEAPAEINLTDDEAAVVRIALTRFTQDMEKQGYYDPEMQKAIQQLRVKLWSPDVNPPDAPRLP